MSWPVLLNKSQVGTMLRLGSMDNAVSSSLKDYSSFNLPLTDQLSLFKAHCTFPACIHCLRRRMSCNCTFTLYIGAFNNWKGNHIRCLLTIPVWFRCVRTTWKEWLFATMQTCPPESLPSPVLMIITIAHSHWRYDMLSALSANKIWRESATMFINVFNIFS